MTAEREYHTLLGLGELKELYPELTGVWSKDKAKFTRMWEDNQEVINNLDIDFEDF